MTAYTPGYKTAKFFVLLFGLILFCAGVVDLFFPTWTFLTGDDRTAKITRVALSGTTPGRTDSSPNQKKFYSYWVIAGGDGNRELPLNVHYQSDSAYHVGDSVAIAFPHDAQNNSTAYVMDDLQTWAVGILFVIFGAAFSVSFYLIWCRANLPIEIPADTREKI
jgi:hypothetical protein